MNSADKPEEQQRQIKIDADIDEIIKTIQGLARASTRLSFTVVFYGAGISWCKTAQLSETPRELVYVGHSPRAWNRSASPTPVSHCHCTMILPLFISGNVR